MPGSNREIARATRAGRKSPAYMSSLKVLEKRCAKLGESVTDGFDVGYDRTMTVSSFVSVAVFAIIVNQPSAVFMR
jgi:hypothetical protein